MDVNTALLKYVGMGALPCLGMIALNNDKLIESIEKELLKKEIAILKMEMKNQRIELLRDVATRLTKRNMAFPVIREIIDLPEEELRGIFYGGMVH